MLSQQHLSQVFLHSLPTSVCPGPDTHTVPYIYTHTQLVIIDINTPKIIYIFLLESITVGIAKMWGNSLRILAPLRTRYNSFALFNCPSFPSYLSFRTRSLSLYTQSRSFYSLALAQSRSFLPLYNLLLEYEPCISFT